MLTIILARSGSKGVKDKNILEIGSRRLSHHSVAAFLESSIPNDIVYSSDSPHYLSLVEEFVADYYPEDSARLKLHQRSVKTSGDNASSWDACREILEDLGNPVRGKVLLISGTCPTITSEDLNKAKAAMKNTHSGLTVRLNDYPVENTFLISSDGRVRPHAMSSMLSARQSAQNIYRPDGHIYWRDAEDIMQRRVFPDRQTKTLDLKKKYYVNIDTWADIAHAKYLLDNI